MKNHAKTTVLLAVTLVSPKDAETTKEFLEANPDLAVESKDDAKCEVFFRGLGMLNLFNAAEDPNLSVVTFRDHTHHLRFL